MKKYINNSLVYAILAMVAGVFIESLLNIWDL